MGGKRSHRLQQTRRFPCPYCGKRFADVLRHLNHRESKCTSWFTLPPLPTRSVSPLPLESMDVMDSTLPPPPAICSEANHTNPQPFRMEFPTAGRIYGQTKSFVDRFHDDKYTSYRVQNPYYPFADQEEWELGSFLLGSGMSMRKVDEFLRLKLVCCFWKSLYFVHSFLLRLRMPGLHLILPTDSEVELRCCQVCQTGSLGRSPSLDMLRRSQCSFSTAMPSTVSSTYSGILLSQTKSTFALSDSIVALNKRSAHTRNG
jgi:hypothetical protein